MLGEIPRFFDPLSMLIVFGGAGLVAMLRTTRADAMRAFRAIGQIFHADPEADAMAAIVAVGKVEKLTEIRNIACIDRIKTAERFLRRAVRRLAQAHSNAGHAMTSPSANAVIRARSPIGVRLPRPRPPWA